MGTTWQLLSRAVILLCVTGAALAQPATPASKRIVENVIFVDTAPPPDTAAHLTAECDAVFVGRLGNAGVAQAPAIGPREWSYTFEVHEIVKGGGMLRGGSFEIALPTGDLEFSDHIERTSIAGSERLQPGRIYVVFLKLNRFMNKLYVAYSTGGLYDVTDSKPHAIVKSNTRDNRKDVAVFLNEIRKAARDGQN